MDITLIGRNVGITDRFRSYVEEKSERVEHLADRALALEVRLCRHHETNGTAGDDRVEMTLIGPGPVIRAEASGIDKFAAFDVALNKLMERVRRAKDRKKVHRGHGGRVESLRDASAKEFAAHGVVPADADLLRPVAQGGAQEASLAAEEEHPSPVVIRRKQFPAEALTVEEAVDRMELVGHDFFLFIDATSGEPSVVYRRVGWNYGVIALDGREEVSERVLASSGASA
ncbi:ribosome hibernation-promoting factor, HPF/YfiA family [Amnibacterium kyonggiense]